MECNAINDDPSRIGDTRLHSRIDNQIDMVFVNLSDLGTRCHTQVELNCCDDTLERNVAAHKRVCYVGIRRKRVRYTLKFIETLEAIRHA